MDRSTTHDPSRQPFYSSLAILTALTLRAVFRLAYRQVDGLNGSIISLTEVNVAADVLNRVLELGRPSYVRIV